MRFAPQAEKEVRVETGELAAALHADVAAQTEGDLPRETVAAGTAARRHQPGLRQTQLAAAVSAEHVYPMAAEVPFGMPVAVIATAAEPARHQLGAAAGPAPPGGLRPVACSQSSVLRWRVLIRP